MEKGKKYIIDKLFEKIEDYFNIHINHIEIEPLNVYDDMYVVGIKETENEEEPYEAKIKELKTINTNDIGLWIELSPFSEITLNKLVNTLENKILSLKTIHVATLTLKKYQNSTQITKLIIAAENKKDAYRQIINLRKNYYSIKTSFSEIQKENAQNTTKIKTDFEVALEPAECY